MSYAVFGPAGSSDSFQGTTLDMPGYLKDFGLDAFEYQCGRGVRIKEEKAAELGKLSRENGIRLSLHAPYFISLSGIEEEKRLGSIRYVMESAAAMHAMGGGEVVLHSGSCGKLTREEALRLAKDTLARCLEALDNEGYNDITLCPETMGKINQLGSLEEVMELCRIDDRLLPTIDFGHLNARTMGSIRTEEDYCHIFELMENAIGKERTSRFHSHFSKIEYTGGGEKKHLTFSDEVYGPDPDLLMKVIAKRRYVPTIICESAGTQDTDALYMREKYYSYL